MDNIFNKEIETCDDFLGGKLRFIQPIKGYRAGVDPVLLAAALPNDLKGRLLDLGCGVGVSGLCALWRNPHLTMVGIESDEDAAQRCIRNAALNQMDDRVIVHHTCLGDTEFADPLKGEEVDIVITNPPWFEPAHSQKAQGSRGVGRQEGEICLDDWLDYAMRKLRTGGIIAIIHRANRSDDILRIFTNRVGNIKLIPIWSKKNQPAKHVIILGNKARKTPMHIMPGCVMHDDNGQFLPHAKDIFMKGSPLYYGEK